MLGHYRMKVKKRNICNLCVFVSRRECESTCGNFRFEEIIVKSKCFQYHIDVLLDVQAVCPKR